VRWLLPPKVLPRWSQRLHLQLAAQEGRKVTLPEGSDDAGGSPPGEEEVRQRTGDDDRPQEATREPRTVLKAGWVLQPLAEQALRGQASIGEANLRRGQHEEGEGEREAGGTDRSEGRHWAQSTSGSPQSSTDRGNGCQEGAARQAAQAAGWGKYIQGSNWQIPLAQLLAQQDARNGQGSRRKRPNVKIAQEGS